MRHFLFTLAVATLACSGSVAPAQVSGEPSRGRGGAQQPTSGPATVAPVFVVRTFPLKNAECGYVAEILRRVSPGGPVAEARHTNTIVFVGTPQEAALVETIIKDLDVPSDMQDQPTLKIIRLQHRSANEVLPQIMSIAAHNNLMRVTTDETRASLIVMSHSTDQLEALERIVGQLDAPAKLVKIDFTLLSADLDTAGAAGAIPEDMKELAADLARFGKISLLGRMSTSALEGGKFNVKGGSAEELDAEISGRIEQVGESGAVRLHAEVTAGLKRAIIQRQVIEGERTGYFRIATTITAKPGEFIVVGTAPTGLEPGQSVILVVRVAL